jgi:prolyl-tRNA editing enzyme YbaK/EbsC (Cys-tRNA(Pro) deacylase)
VKASVRRVQQAVLDLGIDARFVRVEASARTAAEAALAVGAEVGQIVKSLVFTAAGRPVLALVSGPNRLDAALLAEVAGGPVARADAAAVRAATGFPIGGVAPLAHPEPLPVYCDRDLLAYDVVWAAAGTPHDVFAIAPGDLVRATAAVVADIAARDGGSST